MLQAPATTARLPIALRAFQSRNYSLYWFGLVLSQTGTWMQKVAEAWLVYRLTNSAFVLGVVTFISMAPLVPVSLLGGVLADRMSRRKLLLISNVGQLFPPLVLALLTWTGYVQVWHIVIADLFLGAFAAIDQPARQAIIADVVPADDLDSAISLSASGLNATRMVGPAIAGILVALFGEAFCFALNGFSFLAVVAVLFLMRVAEKKNRLNESARTSLVNGFKYLAADTRMIYPISLVVIVSLFIIPYQTVLPVFARDILQVGAGGLGFLNMAAGLGAVLGALGVASLRPGKQRAYLFAIIVGLAVAVALFAASNSFAVAFVTLIATGAGVVAIKAISFTLIQQQLPDEFRGRVMAFVTMLSGGTPAIGGLMIGFAASRWSAPIALGVGAIAFLLVCLILSMQRVSRSVHE